MSSDVPPVIGHANGAWYRALVCRVAGHRLTHVPPETADQPRRYTFCTRCEWRQWYRGVRRDPGPWSRFSAI
jgi:hypothetical protein